MEDIAVEAAVAQGQCSAAVSVLDNLDSHWRWEEDSHLVVVGDLPVADAAPFLGEDIGNSLRIEKMLFGFSQ